MVCLDMSDYDKALDVANFVRIYQQNTGGLLIGDLQEVVQNYKSVELIWWMPIYLEKVFLVSVIMTREVENSKMKDLIIVGAGGFGRETLMAINEINEVSMTWNVLGFIDDNTKALDGIACDKNIIGNIENWTVKGDEEYVLSIAQTDVKRKIAELLKQRGAKFATIIHPTARLDKTTEVGEGVILAARTDVTTNCKIGNFVFCNVAAQVGHDAIIGDYCTLFPNCSIAGGSVLGNEVTVGTAASTYPGIRIGDRATVGMNSAVVRNVKPNTTVMGVPAKKII